MANRKPLLRPWETRAALHRGFAWNPTPHAIPLQAIGMPGCNAHIVPETILPVVGSNHWAAFTISVPDSTSLFGTSFVNQAIVLDPSGQNALGATTSDAARAMVGG